VKQKDIRVFEFQKLLKEKMDALNISHAFLDRAINEGFSGGEKKKMEILQAMMLEPSLLILDETDSGLDIDALKIVAHGIKELMSPKRTILLITHYDRLLQYIEPDEVHIMQEGSIIRSGSKTLAKEIQKKGFVKKEKKEPSFQILD
jgi:Fe-S cluster assembly ATP-binding protein